MLSTDSFVTSVIEASILDLGAAATNFDTVWSDVIDRIETWGKEKNASRELIDVMRAKAATMVPDMVKREQDRMAQALVFEKARTERMKDDKARAMADGMVTKMFDGMNLTEKRSLLVNVLMTRKRITAADMARKHGVSRWHMAGAIGGRHAWSRRIVGILDKELPEMEGCGWKAFLTPEESERWNKKEKAGGVC